MLSSATLALPKFQSANPEFFGDSGFSMKILRVRYAIYDITVSAVSIPCLESLKVSCFTILHPANQFWTGQVKTGAKTGGGEEKVLQEIHITTRRGAWAKIISDTFSGLQSPGGTQTCIKLLHL